MVGATEDAHNGNQLKPSKQPVAPGIVYPSGVRSVNNGAESEWYMYTMP